MKKFETLIKDADWSAIYNIENAEDKYNMFLQIYKQCYDTAFPEQTKTHNKRKLTGKPWIMSWLQDACDRKNALYANFIKKPTMENKNTYTKHKKWVEKMVYIAKRKYYNNLIERHNTDAKKQWKIINSVINRNTSKCKITKIKIENREITNKNEIAEVFNEYFCNIAAKLKTISEQSPHRLGSVNPANLIEECISLSPCTYNDIFDIISGLNNSTTSDYSVTALKSVNCHISDIFYRIKNIGSNICEIISRTLFIIRNCPLC